MFVKVNKNLRKFQAQFREKLRQLRLRQNDGFLIKKSVYIVQSFLPCETANFQGWRVDSSPLSFVPASDIIRKCSGTILGKGISPKTKEIWILKSGSTGS